MNTKTLDSRISEFKTEEQASSYDHWFRVKVQESIDDKRPRIPHDQVAQRIETILAILACTAKANAFQALRK